MSSVLFGRKNPKKPEVSWHGFPKGTAFLLAHDFAYTVECVIPLSERQQQNSSVCHFEAQAAAIALRREKVASFPCWKRTFERRKRNGGVTYVTAPIPGRIEDRGILKRDWISITMGVPDGHYQERYAQYFLRGSHLNGNAPQSLPCRGEDRHQNRSGSGGMCFP